VTRGEPVVLVTRPDAGFVVAWADRTEILATPAELAAIEREDQPRWIWWSAQATAVPLVRAGVRLARCWDISAVHRLQHGGWQADPGRVWAALHGLTTETMPELGQLNLLSPDGDDGGDPEDPCRSDGHLRPEWTGGGWARDGTRAMRWARLAWDTAAAQRRQMPESRYVAAAHAESAAELLCVELEAGGLPVDRSAAEALVAGFIGPRPADAADALALRRRRDDAVLRHAPGIDADLRNPAQVKRLLAQLGFDVPDTRSWRLESLAGAHPVIEELLSWRKAERIATTYGYSWLDENVGADGRLRGGWSGSDGAAGRMTAGAGLHNMPAELRSAVAATPGHVLVRADLGQIEPRVLAAVSGDRALLAAARDDDLYAPIATRLRVERAVAKVAVLAAMYGQTSGTAGEALRGLDAAYPTAMRYLRAASEEGRAGRSVRTYGGRVVPMWPTPDGLDETAARSVAAARGRFARNAVVQGAAAELFKAWAVTVRARTTGLGAEIVLCLHDELLVHAPIEHGAAVAVTLDQCLAEAAARWFGAGGVRFVADISVIQRWSEAKA
jgi:DNA polymerase-1